MRIDPELVSRVARLAALSLDREEELAASRQLTRIVEHFETLRTIPEEELLDGAAERPGPFRDDEVVLMGQADPGYLEANAPEFAHGHFVVPRVVSRHE